MDSDALSLFLGFPVADQLEAVAQWSLKRLRGLLNLHDRAEVKLSREVEVAIGKRISAGLDQLERFMALTDDDQLQAIDELELPAAEDLLSSYLAWSVLFGDHDLDADVHAKMLQRCRPGAHAYPLERDMAAQDAELPAEELQARLSARHDRDLLMAHLGAYEEAESRADATTMARLTSELLAKRKD